MGSDAGRNLVAMRKRVAGICPVCGTEFEGYTNKLYCSPKCKRLAWARANKDELNQRRREQRRLGETETAVDQ